MSSIRSIRRRAIQSIGFRMKAGPAFHKRISKEQMNGMLQEVVGLILREKIDRAYEHVFGCKLRSVLIASISKAGEVMLKDAGAGDAELQLPKSDV